MSQVITNAFASYWQACLTDEVPVVLDTVVLANIPDLDPDVVISPDDGLPPAAHIVYRQAVDQRGHINNDAVAYTIVMDTRVGDFEFNAMYLINTETNLVGMIVHKGLEAKLKTDEANGQTGNSLVKSMLMEYDRASLATVTTVDASTWQIDYAARLHGLDDDMRALAMPLYGPAWFEGDGFEVFSNAGIYHVRPGIAVIDGLLAVLSDDQTVAPDALPMGVWVDVYRAGSLLGAWENHVTLTLNKTDLIDYTDSCGYQHRVAHIATLSSDGSVTDTRRQRTHDHYWDELVDPPSAADLGGLPQASYRPRTDSLNNQQGAIPLIQNQDMNTCVAGDVGLYDKVTCANSPPSAGEKFYCETKSIYASNALIQLAYPNAGSGVLAWRNYGQSAGAWDALWREAYDTGNPPPIQNAPPVVGAVLMFDSLDNPAAIYPGTTWGRIAVNQHLRGAAEGEGIGLYGGSDISTLAVEHMPYHNHTVDNHAHHVPGHAHSLFLDQYSGDAGTLLENAPSSTVAIANDSATSGAYYMHASVGGDWAGASSVAGEGDTWGASPDTDARGSGAAFSVLNAFYKLHVWKRLS
ncbi:phage tail-collar fiber domain-containing protein [Aeromonas enterica]